MSNNDFSSLKRKSLEKYFGRMNSMQKEAVFTVDGPLLVLAGAGSGKTTVIVNRIANMLNFGNAYYNNAMNGDEDACAFLQSYIDGETDDTERLRDIIAYNPVKPWNILAITFTNKAAGELKERLYAMLGDDALNIHAATFHSACVRILRQEITALGYSKDFTIYDADDSQRLLKAVMAEMEINEKSFPPRSILSEISSAKNRMITSKQMLESAEFDYRAKTVAKIYSVYQSRLRAANAVDFDDILLLTVEILENNPETLMKYQNRYRYILVDEYQDTNRVQFRLVSILSQNHENICVVGDDDQSIYKFRGADISNILNFENQFNGCKVIRLEQNYRSTQTILDAANAVIRHNFGRKEKALWTDGECGDKIFWYKACDENDEAKFIASEISESFKETGIYGNNAILYRTNAQSNMLERTFVRSGIPYKVYGGMRFYDRKEIKDITAYLSFINNTDDMLRFKRIINEPKRGIGDTTLTVLEQICNDLKLSPLDIMRNADEYVPLSKKSGLLKEIAVMFDSLIESSQTDSLEDFLNEVLKNTGYMAYLKAMGPEGESKIENVEELKTSIAKYAEELQGSQEEPSLSGFLEEIALYTEADRDSGNDAVTLMTIHSAKGLEYDNVFVIGMEEGLFPSSRSFDSIEDLEEERRLAYVAITRAKRRLVLTSTAQRMLYGHTQHNVTSRFIGEIKEKDSNLIIKHDNTQVMREIRPDAIAIDANALTAVQSSTLQQQIARSKTKTAGSQNLEFTAGERILHNIFGEGTVLSVAKMGGDAKLEVAFDNVGTKNIMANFSKIVKLS